MSLSLHFSITDEALQNMPFHRQPTPITSFQTAGELREEATYVRKTKGGGRQSHVTLARAIRNLIASLLWLWGVCNPGIWPLLLIKEGGSWLRLTWIHC
jgi:hypothetical protein